LDGTAGFGLNGTAEFFVGAGGGAGFFAGAVFFAGADTTFFGAGLAVFLGTVFLAWGAGFLCFAMG